MGIGSGRHLRRGCGISPGGPKSVAQSGGACGAARTWGGPSPSGCHCRNTCRGRRCPSPVFGGPPTKTRLSACCDGFQWNQHGNAGRIRCTCAEGTPWPCGADATSATLESGARPWSALCRDRRRAWSTGFAIGRSLRLDLWSCLGCRGLRLPGTLLGDDCLRSHATAGRTGTIAACRSAPWAHSGEHPGRGGTRGFRPDFGSVGCSRKARAQSRR
mmetsp:Transcript_104565/g.223488  ORF Transcript_104565/g.223488 Transcript_104565/m.223488 type:complete len:216 (+) Transcript_104565:127-774(+)